jgi:transposase
MLTLKISKPIPLEEVKLALKAAKSPADFKRWQIIYLVLTQDVDASYLADITGYSKANVYSIVQQHNNSKNKDVSIKSRGGRRRSLLSVEEETSLMKGLEEKALKGQILSFWDIKKVVEKKVGKAVSDDFIWDLFKRNGWTKHTPRPHHPKKNQALQDEFKKNSRAIWMPSSMISNLT